MAETVNSAEKYRSSGQKYSMHGHVFQLKVLMIILHRACKNGYEFSLATEIDGAKTFDDVLFKYKKDNQEMYRFVQVKHIKEEDKKCIKYCHLFEGKEDNKTNNNFYLLKYYKSFLDILANSEKMFPNLKLKDLTIYTNIGIDFDDLTSEGIELQQIDDEDDIFNDKSIGDKIPVRYQFSHIPDKVRKRFYESFSNESHQMAKELAKRVWRQESIDKSKDFKKYHYALVKEKVIDISTRKLHDSFMHNKGLSESAAAFWKSFLAEGLLCSKVTENQFWQKVNQQELKLVNNFGQTELEEPAEDELPVDRVNEYLNLLVLAVHQPNESQLDNIIKKEISQEFNIMDSTLIANEFYQNMWEWMTESQGRFLSHLDGMGFFENAKKRWTKLNVIGVTSDNQEKNLNFGHFFQDTQIMEAHLNSEECINNIVAPISTALTFIKVAQVLMSRPKDSYAAVHILHLLTNKERYLTIFDSDDPFILVAEWGTDVAENKQKELEQLIHEILCKLKPECQQKFLLISPNTKLEASNVENYQKLTLRNNIVDRTSFQELTAIAQKRISEKEVTLQGCKISLQQLLDGKKDVIDEEVLSYMVNDENIIIGHYLEDAGEDYMQRKFIIIISYPAAEFLLDISTDILALHGTTITEVLQWAPGVNVCNFEDQQYHNKLSQIIIIQNIDQFPQVCQHYQTHVNIHLLLKDGGNLWILESKGIPAYYNENELLELNKDERMVVIDGDHNAGKSTSMKKLAFQFKKNHPDFWVLLIDLQHLITNASQTDLNSVDGIINLISVSEKLKNKFEKDMLCNCIKVNGKIAMFFDEYDGDHTAKILPMLSQLQTQTKVSKMWIFTQLEARNELKAISSLCYSMLLFSPADHQAFLTKIWRKNMEFRKVRVDENCLSIFVNSITSKFTETAKQLSYVFLGNPLHAQMIAEVFQDQLESFLKSETFEMQFSFELPVVLGPSQTQPMAKNCTWRCKTDFELLILYEKFIKDKIETFIRSKMPADDNITKCLFETMIYPQMLNFHQNFAFHHMFGDLANTVFHVKYEDPNVAIEKASLIHKVNSTYRFRHSSFIDYFVAQKMSKILQKLYDFSEDDQKLLFNYIFGEKARMFRFFLDSILARDSAIHYASMNNKTEDFKKLLSENPQEVHSRDMIGRTPLHYACAYDAPEIAKFIISKDTSCISTLDNFNLGPICYAMLGPCSHLMKLMFKSGENYKEFMNTLKCVMPIYLIQGSEQPQLAHYLSSFANEEQKYVMIDQYDYNTNFLKTVRESDYFALPLDFLFACKTRQQEMLSQNDYEIIKALITKNPLVAWRMTSTCLDEQMKDKISNLKEYKTAFSNLLKLNNLNMLWFLIKLATRKQLESIWGKKGYVSYFKECSRKLRSDMMLELMSIFQGEDLLSKIEYCEYIDELLTRKQTFWAAQIFLHCNHLQRRYILNDAYTVWNRELLEALDKCNMESFCHLLNFVTNKSQRSKLLKFINHITVFKTAVRQNDLGKLIVLSVCTEEECMQLTNSLEATDYINLSLPNLINSSQPHYHRYVFMLLYYARKVEREEIFTEVNLLNHTNSFKETIEKRGIIAIDYVTNGSKILNNFSHYETENVFCQHNWSFWGKLLYMFCKDCDSIPILNVQ